MFKIGQAIVCVRPDGLTQLKKNEIYTVIDVRAKTGGVKLAEATADDTNYSGYFKKDRFKPIDYSILKNTDDPSLFFISNKPPPKGTAESLISSIL